MIVGPRQGGFSISEAADVLGFSRTSLEWCEKLKNILREVREEGPEWSKPGQRQEGYSNTNNRGTQKSISEHTMCQTSKWIDYSSRRLNKSEK